MSRRDIERQIAVLVLKLAKINSPYYVPVPGDEVQVTVVIGEYPTPLRQTITVTPGDVLNSGGKA